MARTIPTGNFYRIWDGHNFIEGLTADLTLLWTHKRYVSLTTLIICGVEALALGPNPKKKGHAEIVIKWVSSTLPAMCAALAKYDECADGSAGKNHVRRGAKIFIYRFRDGFAHSRAPKQNFAIAEDHEVGGEWADWIQVEGRPGRLFALNVDRLAREFLQLLPEHRPATQ